VSTPKLGAILMIVHFRPLTQDLSRVTDPADVPDPSRIRVSVSGHPKTIIQNRPFFGSAWQYLSL